MDSLALTKTEAVAAFLKQHTHPDLADLYSKDMEVQVNVAKGNGQRVDSGDLKSARRAYFSYTDGFQTWKSFRIPNNAKTSPTYVDTPLQFSLVTHAEAIGMTGWDWQNLTSRWVAYDFDAAIGHSEKHAKVLTDDELLKIQTILTNIPFVTIRKSTSGRGLHIYIMLEGVHTKNHNEHAALARAILSMLSALVGFDFGGKVDICGGNMWVWHRKMKDSQGQGLALVKQGTKLSQVPANWRDYIGLIEKKAKRALPNFVYSQIDTTNPDKVFETLTSQRVKTEVDPKHRALIQWLADNGAQWWWDDENNMLVTHTYHLKEAHEALALRGEFKTISQGAERGMDHNCFCYPLRDGAWTVRRFSLGTKEENTWEQDGAGWTRCYFNRDPDIHSVSKLHGAVEHEKGGYAYRHISILASALVPLGIDLKVPAWLSTRPATLKPIDKSGRYVVHVESTVNDIVVDMADWINERGKWRRVLTLKDPPMTEEETCMDCDELVRHVTTSGVDDGWMVKSGGTWTKEPIGHAKLALGVLGYSPKEQLIVMGTAVNRPWKLVSRPFQPEYPGDREWNRNAAQFAVNPTQDIENLNYPSWMKILTHCGRGLNEAVKKNKFCVDNNILTGAEYLMLWIASMFKAPHVPTTYLAFWGNQDCGKSIMHEAISRCLVTGGVVRADHALQSQSNFNEELRNAFLCVVEETDLKRDKAAYNKIKDWVTSPEVMIHAKGSTPYMVPNRTHWIQCSNEQDACPIFPGDTRITLVHVNPLSEEEMIPKHRLMEMLTKEAPDFLAALLAMELPEPQDRLGVPTLETETKARAIEKNRNLLEQFIKEKVYPIPGAVILGEAFYQEFHMWLDAPDKAYWTRQKTARQLPEQFPRGRWNADQKIYYGNMSFDPNVKPGERLALKNNLTLKPESECE